MKKFFYLLSTIITSLSFVACHNSGNNKPAEDIKTIPFTGADVIVLLAHPNMENSRMNAALAKAAEEVEGVQVINIYDYPCTADAYREVVKNARSIVYEFPLYWASAPHLLKQWTDEVFMTFVTEGLIAGKQFMVVTTTGSEEAAYQHDGRNMYTMTELLAPYHCAIHHAGMEWNDPLVVYGNTQSAEEAEKQLQEGVKEYKSRLKALVAKNIIALSFDDGPNLTTTMEMLDVMEKHNVVGSFFVIGNNITEETSKAMIRAKEMGCEIENHSRTHATDLDKISADSLKAEIRYTSDLVKKYTGREPEYFRPPYINVSQSMYDAIELPFICGDGCFDWEQDCSAEKRIELILANAKDSQIILLHDFEGNHNTVEAIDTVIPELKKRGFRFVTVGDLFRLKGVKGERNKIYTIVE